MATSVLTFVIVGQEDHPIYEADLSSRAVDQAVKDVRDHFWRLLCSLCFSFEGRAFFHAPLFLVQERAQYLHQFVLHAALDAVEEQVWTTSAMYLGNVDKFNNLQARGDIFCSRGHGSWSRS
jgi:trafficking protein particle complex subunit 2